MTLEDKITQYFKNNGIELEDSPQLLDNYLYIEYWNGVQQVKMRMNYLTTKEEFLLLNDKELVQKLDYMMFLN